MIIQKMFFGLIWLQLFSSCKLNSENSTDRSILLRDSLIIKEYSGRCYCGDSIYVEVLTKYIEVPDSVCECAFGFVTIDQKINLVKGKEVIEVINPLFKKQKILLGNDSVLMSSTFINSAKCLQKDGFKKYFYIYGSNNVDPPHEFFGVISLNGNWQWYYYGDQNNTYAKKGDDKVLKKEFGKQAFSDLKDMTDLSPP